MNKIVAGVSAAALAVSALATSAFAANGEWTVKVTDPKLASAKITLEATVTPDGDVTPADLNAFQANASEIKAVLTQTVTGSDGIYDLEFDGTMTFNEVGKINYTDQTTSAKKSTEAIGTGSASIEKLAIGGGLTKEVKMKVTGLDDLAKQALGAVDSFEKYSTKPTLKLTLTTTVWSAQNLYDVLGATDYNKWFKDKDGSGKGLPKNADNLKTALSKGLVKANGSLITATISGAACGTLNGTIDDWDVKAIECTEGEDPFVLKDGSTYTDAIIPFKGNFNFDALKAMSNGGTVTIKFDKSVSADSQYSLNILFENANLYLGSTNSYNVVGDTLTFDMPADFSGTLNGIYGYPVMTVGSTDWTMPDKCSIVSVTLKAKDGSQVVEATTTAPQANDGDTNSNKPAETNKPASNNGGDKNQPTGVAIAIVPAIVAAAGVVISKKRK